MTKFQFILIMKTLLAMFRLRLDDLTPKAWEKAEKEYSDIKELFSLWKQDEGEDL